MFDEITYILNKPLRQRVNRVIHRNHPRISQRRILQPFHLYHALPIIHRQLLLQELYHRIVEPLLLEDSIHETRALHLLRCHRPPEHENVVGAVHAQALREDRGGPVLRYEAQGGERDLQVAVVGGEEDVGGTGEPGGAGTNGGAIKCEDEDFFVVDYGAELQALLA